MKVITIRDMTAADWDAVAAIYQAGIDTNTATFETVCPPYAVWDAGHLACCRLVAVDEVGAAIGWAALSPVSGRAVYAGVAELGVYIAAGQQGKGVGTALMAALIAASEAAGIWTLQAGILEGNEASLRLHGKCGFRRIGHRERIGRDRNGVWRDTVLMERRSTIVGVE